MPRRRTGGEQAADNVKRHRCEQQSRLCRAALCVALEKGFGHVTLDAVAQRAGISKGGLLHHYPSKTHLIRALLTRYASRQEASAARKPVTRSQVQDKIDPLAIALLIAGAENPRLLEPATGILLPQLLRNSSDMDAKHQSTLLMAALAKRFSAS